jgi:putative methyltransferase (TIGR04325 family)
MVDAYRTLRRAAQAIKDLPAIRGWQARSYEHFFESAEAFGFFRGVFDTFEQAVGTAPHNRPIGFDLPEAARMYDDRHDQVFAYDYPVLFWLTSILGRDAREVQIFDFGGHVGLQFYGYQKVLPFPPGLRWRVCDMPAVVEQGRALATQRGVTDRLSFTTSIADADGADVFIAAGSLQFVQSPSLGQSLERLARKPTHLLLNKIPLRDGPGFVTLQNAGTAFVAQYVFERRAFVDDLTRLGYEVVDRWEDRVHSCHVPFHPDKAVPHYSGLYLRRSGAPPRT